MKWINTLALLLIFSIAALRASAQPSRYIIKLKNKGGTPYALNNPSAYLSQRSIERRTRYNIAIDSTDLPVTPSYLQSIRNVPNVTILNVSRWLNQVSVQITDAAALNTINNLPFVQSSAPIAARMMSGAKEANKKFGEPATSTTLRMTDVMADYFNYGLSYSQVHIHNGEFLHNIGLRGQSMIVGMLDAGFHNYLTVPSFDSIRTNGQILGTWDFEDREASVNEDNSHGTSVLSTIAANIPGQFVGTAPKASFYLYRTENADSEYPIEEHNWVCGAERVDSVGGDLISSSLGYSQFDDPAYDYTYAQMNGNTTIVARGADLAAKKGLLVVNSAGNSGASAWKYIMSPADGDSVLAVGGVFTNGQSWGGSSYGPTADGQVKPDVAAVGAGAIVQYSDNSIGGGNGTSYAAPIMTGLATSLWQGFREFNNMKIINALRQSGSKATAPDDRIGYGIPDMKKAVMLLLKDYATSTASVSNCKTTLSWNSKDVAAMKYEIERKAPGESAYTKVSERFGTGSSFANQSYMVTDSLANIQLGTVSYRIRQIIDTAAASFVADYIDTVSVNFSATCVTTGIDPVDVAANNILIVPNPAGEQFTLKITTPSPVQNLLIRITDAIGQEVAKLARSKGTGTATIPVSIAHLAKGKYFVSVYNGMQLIGTKELLKL